MSTEEKPIREYDRFIIRLPDGLRERLADQAEHNGRSMNAEAVELLNKGLRNRADIWRAAHYREVARLQSVIEGLERELSHQRSELDRRKVEGEHMERVIAEAERKGEPILPAYAVAKHDVDPQDQAE